MPRFVFIYYVLLVYICYFYAIRPLFWSLNSFYTFFPLKHDLFCTHISSLYIIRFFFIITSCNYLFIISTCHVISSVIFWRHAQQVAYHVIYKVLVTWHMIFQKKCFICTILISSLWIKCFKDIYFSRVFILTKIVNDLKDFVHKNISSVVCCLMSNKKTWRGVLCLALILRYLLHISEKESDNNRTEACLLHSNWVHWLGHWSSNLFN